MSILLLAATAREIEPFLTTQTPQQRKAAGLTVLIGGVGVAASVFHLTNQLSHHHYDCVIQAGIGGAFEASGLQPGEVVTVHQDAFGDLGAYEPPHFKSISDMGLCQDLEWLHNPNPLLKKMPYKQVAGITVHTITGDAGMVAALHQKWKAGTESMEGAALHYVCLKKQVPFIQLRALSNFVGDRDKNNWKLKEAVDALNEAVGAVVGQVS